MLRSQSFRDPSTDVLISGTSEEATENHGGSRIWAENDDMYAFLLTFPLTKGNDTLLARDGSLFGIESDPQDNVP